MTPCNLALIYSTLVKELFFVVVSGKKTCLLTLWTWQPLWKVKELDVSLRKVNLVPCINSGISSYDIKKLVLCDFIGLLKLVNRFW